LKNHGLGWHYLAIIQNTSNDLKLKCKLCWWKNFW